MSRNNTMKMNVINDIFTTAQWGRAQSNMNWLLSEGTMIEIEVKKCLWRCYVPSGGTVVIRRVYPKVLDESNASGSSGGPKRRRRDLIWVGGCGGSNRKLMADANKITINGE